MRRLLAAVPPASGAVVMGTGIVSTDLSLDGHETLSRVLLGIAVAVWLALGSLLVARAVLDRARVRREATSPAALTGVAGTAVLGTRLSLLGWSWAGAALLAIAFALWLALLGPVLRCWRTPTVGVSFVLTVSTEALAVLAATLAARERAPWLVDAACVLLALGLAFYLFVLASFDWRQLVVGRGDHWVSGGALAITALAAGRITLACRQLDVLGGLAETVKVVGLAVWTAAMLWLPALLVAEVARPRWSYDVRRWATVFPLGMYAACSFTVGQAAHASALTRFARAWTWVAFAVWLVVLVAMLRRWRDLSPSPRPAARAGA